MTEQDNKHDQQQWIEAVKARGLGGALGLALDALEPVGPLGAQILWLAQPVSWLFGWHQAVGDLAGALEDPEGIARLRRQLEDDVSE